MDTVYIVTGASGFLGCNIVRQLCADKRRVRIFARSPQKTAVALNGLDYEAIYGDITDKAAIFRLFFDTDSCQYVVIHTAGLVDTVSKEMTNELMQVNVEGTSNIVDACKSNNVVSLVYVSSVSALDIKPKGSVVSEQTSFNPDYASGGYGKSKAIASQIVLDAASDTLKTAVILPSAICGGHDFNNTNLTRMIVDFYHGKIPVAINGGCDVIDVLDVCKASINAIGKNGVYLLTNQYYTVKQILDTVSNFTNRKKVKLTIPVWVAYLALPFIYISDKIFKRPRLITAFALKTLSSNVKYDNSLAIKALGFNPRGLESAIGDAVEFLKNNKLI